MLEILLVDDDPDARAVTREALEALEYRVVEARDETEALATLQLSPPELILVDLTQGQREARTMLKLLRSHPTCANVPVLVMTTLLRHPKTALHKVAEKDLGALLALVPLMDLFHEAAVL